MVDLVNFKELLKHDRAIKVGNVGYGLVVLCVYELDLTHS